MLGRRVGGGSDHRGARPALLLRMRQARGKELPGRLPERRGNDPTPRPPGG